MMFKKVFPLIIVIIFAFIAGLPLLHKGLPPTHDGEYHVVRFYEFYKTLSAGNFYPRWAEDFNNGYGIPLFNFVYPLPNYVASLFHFIGISFIDSFKLEMFLATIIGGVFFYLWAKEFWGELGGIVSSVFYTFSPYHILDIYIRGSVGEVWALAFFPAFLWSITRFIKYKQKIFIPLSSIFLSLIIFSHNILALMFLFFAICYCVFLLLGDKGNKRDWGKGIFVFLLGISLSAIFWLPAILEKQYVTGLEIFDVFSHFPDLHQLLIPSWGTGFSGENIANQMSFQIGVANLVGVMLSLFFILKRKDKNRSIASFFVFLFFVIFFLMLKISLPIWQTVPFINYFQFPWRLLSLEILIVSFLAGSIAYFWKSKIVALFLVLTTFFLGIGYAKPAYYHYRDDNYYITRPNFIDGTNSPDNVFNTIFFDTSLDKEKAKIKFLKGEGKTEQKIIGATYYNFMIEVMENSEIQVNTAYFPNWRVFINKEETKIYKTKRGLFSFDLPKGHNIVEIQFEDTPIRKMGFFLSLISSSVLIVFFVKLKNKAKS